MRHIDGGRHYCRDWFLRGRKVTLSCRSKYFTYHAATLSQFRDQRTECLLQSGFCFPGKNPTKVWYSKRGKFPQQ